MIHIQFITHQNENYSYLESARLALLGGCKWIQLRMKNASNEEIIRIASELQPLCKQHEATFIIDDHVELVREVHADGVHLGKLDMPVTEARDILGSGIIIGGTANTFEDIRSLYSVGADYIGCGPFRFTTTKEKLSPILGIDGYRNIMEKIKEENINIPIVAIGGILYEDIRELMKTGINGIAVSGAVLRSTHPIDEMKRMIEIDNKI